MVIFGCALVVDETTKTYRWVLQTFLNVMLNKAPSIVITDGDGAIKEATREVFPNAKHCLCAWHLNKNACSTMKNLKLLKDFKKAMYHNFTLD